MPPPNMGILGDAMAVALPDPTFKHTSLEHVTVLFQGRRAHAWVHDSGTLINLPFNPKATSIYYNITRYREAIEGKPRPTYNDLTKPPEFVISELETPRISGPMLLWCAPYPGWEPDNSPWDDYLTEDPPFKDAA